MIPDSTSHFDIEEFKKKITPHDHDKVIFLPPSESHLDGLAT
jgi:hypothetical protein